MLRNAEESLRRYKIIVDAARDGIFTIDLVGRFKFLNRAALETTGYGKEELIGKSMTKVLPKKYIPTCLNVLQKAIRGKALPPFQIEIINKQGRKVPIELFGGPIRRNGRITEILGIARDITERKQKEEELRRSQVQARHLLEFQIKVIDTAVVWIDLLDAEGNVTLWNRAAELISGYSREEVIGHKKIWEWLYPDPKYRAEIFADAKRVIERGERVDIDETTIRCKDGTLKNISWYSNDILDERGKPVGSIAVGVDITEIKKAQEKVRESEERFRALSEKYELLLKTASEGIGAVDPDENLTFVNRAFANMLGYEESELVGMNMRELVSASTFEEMRKGTERRKRGESDRYEIVMYRKDGEPAPSSCLLRHCGTRTKHMQEVSASSPT